MAFLRNSSLRTLSRLAAFSVICLTIPSGNAEEGGTTQLKRLIQDATAGGKTVVHLPEGRILLDQTLVLEGLKNLEITGNNTTLVMTRPLEVLRLQNCENITVRKVNFDYQPLCFTQGRITGISQDKRTLQFEIHQGYPSIGPEVTALPRHFFDAATRLWKRNVLSYDAPKISTQDGRSGEAIFNTPQTEVAAGDLIAFDRRWLDRASCVLLRLCKGRILFEDVTVFASPTLAFSGRYMEGDMIFRRVQVARGPKPEGATEERLLSTNADAINFSVCRKGPLLEDCDFSFMGDDALNVHGVVLPVLQVISPTEILTARPGQREFFPEMTVTGERVRVMAEGTFEVIHEGALASLKALLTTEGISNDQVAKLFPWQSKKPDASFTVYRLILATPMDDLKIGQWLDFPELNCPGFAVKNSRFHDHRARGLRIMASGGRVEGNRFERIGATAIQIGPELCFWREAGWVNDVQIRNNEIVDTGTSSDAAGRDSYVPGAIAICARTDVSKPPYPGGNSNIVIENNLIEKCPASAIHAYGTTKVVIRDNRISLTNQAGKSDAGAAAGLTSRSMIDFDGVSDPIIEGNGPNGAGPATEKLSSTP